MMKTTMIIAAALTLSACMDGGGATVSRAGVSVSGCSGFTGASAAHMQGTGVRCGPQTVLPYTIR